MPPLQVPFVDDPQVKESLESEKAAAVEAALKEAAEKHATVLAEAQRTAPCTHVCACGLKCGEKPAEPTPPKADEEEEKTLEALPESTSQV